jgi:hypothetical protein
MAASLGAALALSAAAQPLGSDLAELNLCLSADCEARGSWAADPWGWANPATMPVGALAALPHGAFITPLVYYRGNAGGVHAELLVPVIAVTWDPVVLEVDALYAAVNGVPLSLPASEIRSRYRQVRIAGAVDLGRTPLGWTGLSVGMRGAVPGTTTDSRFFVDGRLALRETDERDYDLTFGLDWRGGSESWLAVGAVVEAARDSVHKELIAPDGSVVVSRDGANNAWFARAGLSLLPMVATGLRSDASPITELARQARLGADFEYRNILIDGEATRDRTVAYLGLDVPLVPTQLHPVSDYLQVWSISGIDTDTGWGLGVGLVGNGPINFLACNGGYSSRPLSPSIGNRVDIWAVNCTAAF